MVQACSRNAKTFSRSSGMAPSNIGNRRPLQPATRAGKADLSGVYRSGRRDARFLFGESKFRWRAQTLSLSYTGSAFAADSRTGSYQEVESVAIFPARIGHRGRSAAARDSCGSARVSGEFYCDVLPGNFACVLSLLGALL